jgi:HPt (histidine-containing phosphotransfer) domain-containing protein
MTHPIRPNLASLSSRLAANNGRVAHFLERAEAQLGHGTGGSTEDDWTEVLRLAHYVAQSSQAAGYADIARQARSVCQHLETAETRPQALEALVRLIGMCGRVELAEEAPRKSSAEVPKGRG